MADAAGNTGDSGVSEDQEEAADPGAEEKSELSVQRCAECTERGGSGGIFCRKCSFGECKRP